MTSANTFNFNQNQVQKPSPFGNSTNAP